MVEWLLILLIASLLALWSRFLWRMHKGTTLSFSPILLFLGGMTFATLPALLFAPVSDPSVRVLALFAGATALSMLFVGYTGTLGMLGRSSRWTWHLLPQRSSRPANESLKLWFFTSAMVVLGIWFYAGIPPIGRAIWLVFVGNAEQAAAYLDASRETLTKNHVFGGAYRGQGMVRVVSLVGWSVLLAWAGARRFGGSLTTPRSELPVIVVLAVLFVGGDGTRGPLLFALAALAVAASACRGPTGPRIAVMAMGAVVVFALMTAVGPKESVAAEITSESLSDSLLALIERVGLGNGQNDVLTIDLIESGRLSPGEGSEHAYKARAVLPGAPDGVPLSHRLFLTEHPGSRSTTFLSTTYLGVLYYDWGLLGVAGGFFVLGSILGGVHAAWPMRAPSTTQLAVGSTAIVLLARLFLNGPLAMGTNLVVLLGIAILLGAVKLPAGLAHSELQRRRPVRDRDNREVDPT